MKIFDLLRHPHLWEEYGGPVGQWVGQWVGPGQIIKNQINVDLIETILFCLKIYDMLRHPHLWVGIWVVRWMGGWVGSYVSQWVGSDHVTKNLINLELIEIIQICLKICRFAETPPPMDRWMGEWLRPGRTLNRINLDLIDRIQLCLKIYDGSTGGSMVILMSNH